ncbi:MAG: Omp28 family outer membrane lipoprotein [Vicingaceae bacterium]|nr:Omp28 family outer membrane lipoprotein [Vicingaceae bacterium]
MRNLFILIFASLIIFVGCDKIDNPIPNTIITDGILWDDSLYTESDPSMRKIIIEEYTGQLCTNCPNGAAEVNRLDSVYGEQLIAVSVHATNFAAPANSDLSTPPDGVLDYTQDFRTEAGSEYETTFGVSGIPKASVSRLNNSIMVGIPQWQIDIDAIKNDVPQISIGLSTLYNDSSRTVKAIVSTEWLAAGSGGYNLQLYLLEDSVIGDQLDGSTHLLQSYTHRHMLRTTLNGTWGTPIPSTNIGDMDTQDFSITLEPEWDKKHCIVVAYIYKVSPDYEIIQAEELHIVADH